MYNPLKFTLERMGIMGEWGRKPRFVNPQSPGTDDFPLVGKGGVALDRLVPRVAQFTLTGATGNAEVLSAPNPEGETVIVIRAVLLIITGTGGSRTLDLGIAANGSTASDTLIDGVSAAAPLMADNIDTQGTNGVSSAPWGSGQFLTATMGGTNGTPGDLVGTVLVEYIKLAA